MDGRRQQLLGYFSENFNPLECKKTCDNCTNNPTATVTVISSNNNQQQQHHHESSPPVSNKVLHVKELERIRLTNYDIQCKREGMISILYDAFPSQCKQCGIRFVKENIGKHLDWHFKQNHEMKEEAKKAQSRNWFVTSKDFIDSKDSDSQNESTPALFEYVTSNSKPNENIKRKNRIDDR